MHLDTELSKAMEAAGPLKEYDDNIKSLLSRKIILAHILSGAVKEFFQMKATSRNHHEWSGTKR